MAKDEPYSRKGPIDLMKEAHARCIEDNCNILLVNPAAMSGTISTWDRFELGVQGALIFTNVVKIAVVYRQEERNAFAEMVGVNRGVNTRVFGDMKKGAMEWLGIMEEGK